MQANEKNEHAKIDMHVHSKYSRDSANELREIIKKAEKAELNAIAITDHGTIEGALKASRVAKEMKAAVKVIVGCEFKTKDSHEILGYFLNDDIKKMNEKSDFEIIDELRKQSALISVPHPYDNFRRRTEISNELALRIDAIEVFNSRCIFNSANERARAIAEKYSLAYTAGSDAHEIDSIGKAGIILKCSVENEEELRKEILRNKNFFGERISLFFLTRMAIKRKLLRKLKLRKVF